MGRFYSAKVARMVTRCERYAYPNSLHVRMIAVGTRESFKYLRGHRALVRAAEAPSSVDAGAASRLGTRIESVLRSRHRASERRALGRVPHSSYRSGESRHDTSPRCQDPENSIDDHRPVVLGPRPARRLGVISNSGIITPTRSVNLRRLPQPRSGSATELRLPIQIPQLEAIRHAVARIN
jgi:hypothetical protein